MALINTLRNKMGKVLVAVIGVAIMSFVLADLLGPNSTLFGNDNNVGEISGESISLQEFQSVIQEREMSYLYNFNRQPSENERPTIRQQAWDLLITRYAFEEQYEKVGVHVTSDEIWDMMQGKNISPGIQQSFVSPETGEFDRDMFLQFLQNLPTLPQENQARWELFKRELKPGRERLKYENLLLKSTYVTKAEAEQEYKDQNDVAEIQYLYIPYYSISDTLVTATDSDYKKYYNENKEKYKVEHTKSLKFVAFDVIPSADDTAFVKEEMKEMKEEFKSLKDDSVFAAVNTDGFNPFAKYHPGTLPVQLKANISNLSKGDVRGPYLENEGYSLYKVSDIYEDTVGYAKASHILFGDDDEAKTKAQEVLREIQNGADFAAKAAEYGTDGTKTRGGDLGWFKSGDMVEEFEDAVFSSPAGLVNRVIKTQFGYHIIKVDEPKTNTTYKIATIQREVLPSDETREEAFRKADLFASNSSDVKSFDANAEQEGIVIKPAVKLKKNDRRISTLGDARQIVQWLFRDASVGEVSEVFELDNTYVIAVMTDEIEEGVRSFEDVKTEITAKVKNELRANIIKEKLAGLSGSLEEISSAYGEDASVYNTSDLKISSNSIPNVGFDPEAIGKAFALESGEQSAPFGGENGVLIIKMENKTSAPEIADYSIYKNQLEQNVSNRIGFGITEAIKENADIVDKRYKFY